MADGDIRRTFLLLQTMFCMAVIQILCFLAMWEVAQKSSGQNLDSSASQSQVRSDATSAKRSKKRKRDSRDEFLAMFARSLDRMAEAFSKIATELIKCNQVHPISENEVWVLLEELGIDNSMFHDAYYFLICHGDAQRALKGCPPNRRKDLLRHIMATNGFPLNN